MGEDVTAFFQVLEGDKVLVGSDAPLGSGLYGVPRWRPGDRVAERREAEVPGGCDPVRQRVIAGAYVWTGPGQAAIIPVVDAEGSVLGEYVALESSG